MARLRSGLNDGEEPGFITSDHPCVWHDPEGYKRPPMYQSPGLIYETIQITLPISPEQCIFLNRQGIKGYLPIKQIMVDDINRRTRFHAEEHFVIRKNEKRDIWFDPGIEPEDSWEKEHQKSTEEIEEGLKKTWDILEKMATIIPRNQT